MSEHINKKQINEELKLILDNYHYSSDFEFISKEVVQELENLRTDILQDVRRNIKTESEDQW